MPDILVVDDSLDMLKLCQRTLECYGHTVTMVHSAELAQKELYVRSFDLMVVDVMLPGLSGFDLLERLKKTKTPHPPIIMLTGRKSPEDVMKAMELGARDYICKPFDREVFITKVHAVLGLDKKLAFAQGQIRRDANIIKASAITSVTEDGLTLVSSSPETIGESLKLDSRLFSEIGISPTILRVMNCKAFTGYYEMTLNFVGLDEVSLKKIRQWIIRQNIRPNQVA